MNKIKNYKSKRPAKYLFCYDFSTKDRDGVGNTITTKYKPADVRKFESDALSLKKAKGVTHVFVTNIIKL